MFSSLQILYTNRVECCNSMLCFQNGYTRTDCVALHLLLLMMSVVFINVLMSTGARTGLWSTICQGTCAIQIVGGLIMLVLSSKFLFDYMATMGLVSFAL